MNGSWVVTSALSITSISGTSAPSAATTNADGSTNDAAACDAGEKSAIEYGLNPAIRPALPSNPITTVPAAGGEVGTDVTPGWCDRVRQPGWGAGSEQQGKYTEQQDQQGPQRPTAASLRSLG